MNQFFIRLERFLAPAVIALATNDDSNSKVPTDDELKTLLFGIHDAFWVIGQTCGYLGGGLNEVQAAAIQKLESLFPLDASNSVQNILSAAIARSAEKWEEIQRFARVKPHVMVMLERKAPPMASELRALLIDFAKSISQARTHVSSSVNSFVAHISDEFVRDTQSAPLTDLSRNASLFHLSSLIGLDPIKAEVRGLVDLYLINKMRVEQGLPSIGTANHLVFYGNPGTGKTTVGRLIGAIYKDLGALTSGHMIEVSRSGLIAGYLGQTALKVEEAVSKALGGVLFIDEAYSLKQQHNDSFGQEAIDTLLKLMEDHRDNLIVIVAGYTEEMKSFLATNPGMQSRFTRYLVFPDYSVGELSEILNSFVSAKGLRLSKDANRAAQILFSGLNQTHDANFGNARFVRNFFERALVNQASRLRSCGDYSIAALCCIEAIDFPTTRAGELS